MASDRIWLRKVLASDPQLARQVASPLVAYRWARSGPVSPKMTAKAARAVAATTIEARNWRQVSHIIGFPPLRSGGRGLAHIGQCEIFEVRLHPRLLAVRGEQFADLAREPHVRGGQHDQVVADTFQIGDQVRGQHHGHAVFGHGAGQVPQEVPARQGSRLATGSSRISSSGRLAMARVRASWARWPPDSRPAFTAGSRPSLLIRSAASFASQPWLRWAPSRRWSAMENTASVGVFWATNPTRASCAALAAGWLPIT